MNERQSQIVDAAIPFILDQGIAVSTAAIAKAAGVSNGTLFNAFATKQALIDAIYLTVKTRMFDSQTHKQGSPFTRETVRRNWLDYIGWARRRPHDRAIMHLLLDAGLVSPAMRQKVEAMGAPYGQWIADALDQGVIRAPSVAYVSRLVFFHFDLVIDMALDGADEEMAFDMLCNSIGLSE